MFARFFLATFVVQAILYQVYAENPSPPAQKDSQDIYVGNFHFSPNDDRLPTNQDLDLNATLYNEFIELYDQLYDQYFELIDYNKTVDEQLEILKTLADAVWAEDATGHKPSQWYFDYCETTISSTTTTWLAETRQANKTIVDNETVVYYYFLATYEFLQQTYYYYQAAWMGTGRTVWCARFINQVLEDKPEWEKAASAAATTLMALIPTFLAFGNLYVPRSSEIFATSMLVGLTSALFGFGLPVKSLSALPKANRIDLTDYGASALRKLETLGGVVDQSLNSLIDYQNWSKRIAEGENESERPMAEDFANLHEKAQEHWKSRRNFWGALIFIVAGIHLVVFLLVITPLFSGYGIPRFIFDCGSVWTALYLTASSSANAFLRLLMWETGYHERVLIYALTTAAEHSLNDMVGNRTERTVQTHLPPLYRPFLSRVMSVLYYVWDTTSHKLGISSGTTNSQRATQIWESHGVISASRSLMVTWKARFLYLYSPKHLVRRLRNGIWTKAEDGGQRWKPLIVLLHLSTSGRNLLKTLFIGMIEVALYVALTFFFAAQWGGNLVITGFALAMMLIFVTIGRAISIMYVFSTSKMYGLHIINCDNDKQMMACLKVICSMKKVLVVVNGATYFEGHRIDTRGEEYHDWLRNYEGGKFDYDRHSTSQTRLTTGGAEPPVSGLAAQTSTPGDVEMASMSSQVGAISSVAIPLHPDNQPSRSRHAFALQNTDSTPLLTVDRPDLTSQQSAASARSNATQESQMPRREPREM